MRLRLTTLAALWAAAAPVAATAGGVSYNREIRPILAENCFACHGPDAAGRRAGLRLDTREGALATLRSGQTAIVPGRPAESELLLRIVSQDEEEVMPPPDSHRRLSDPQRELLRRWIAAGAAYEGHWAYQPVAAGRVPAAADLPGLDPALTAWPRNPIDWFVLSRLVEAGLTPSPPADPMRLARRLALDLTGLPAAPDFVARFRADRLEDHVAELFASPRYGERMAVDWLDAARFADTQGYQNDPDQDMHPWRDWVIAAYNRNLPFDRFTIEQLAGDLLPSPTREQRIATGFHRNHMVNTEGGVIPAEFIAEYTADRVETTATVWMAQTFNCTRCHDHKFDPLTQRDFYSLKAFFNNVNEQGDGKLDRIVLPSAEVEARLQPLQDELAALEDRLAARQPPPAVVRSWADRLVRERLAWHPLEITSLAAPQGRPKAASDGRSFDLSLVTSERKPVAAKVRLPAGRTITALRLECSTEGDGARIGLGPIALLREGGTAVALAGAAEGVSHSAPDAEKALGAGAKPAATLVILQPGPNQPPSALVWRLTEPWTIPEGTPAEFSVTVTVAGRETEWRLLWTDAPVDQLVTEATLELAAKPPAQLSAAETATLQREQQLAQPENREAQRTIAGLTTRIEALRAQLPAALVMVERGRPKETFILKRGAYDQPGEKVTAATPAVLPGLPADAPRNRLGLARWLVSGEHPLTARVTVNRLWQSIFGTGLVRTSEDFGTQGEWPSHPELLDWLAGEFVRSGWNVQHVLRLILTSATYRQDSRVTPDRLARDPDNRLLSRGPRFRLHAEFVRDQALAAAGLLSARIGGRSVRPYQPAGLYEAVTVGSAKYVEGKGEDLHRRSLYTYWRRTIPHPAMTAFDAPGREVCSVRRSRSNTPLQALNLMNDPTYVEAARHLAARMIAAEPTLPGRIRHGYRLLLARDPAAAEMDLLTRTHARALADFQADPAAADAFLKPGQPVRDDGTPPPVLAAMTTIASTLLCLDEAVTKP